MAPAGGGGGADGRRQRRTGGAGVEFVIWGPWTAKAEYLYADLNGLSCNVACGGPPAFNMGGSPISINVRENIVRAGLNYRIWQR